MSDNDEDWVGAAMSDESMAAELLVRLRRAKPPPPPPPPPSALPFKWSVRQPRSRPMMLNKKLIPRASPSTPLSWSGATSVSGVAAAAAADGSEESSQLPLNRPDATRSKVSGKNGTTNKRWGRKKKTLDELKEEEILLLGERRHLKKEIAELCVNLEKERARNESLKRLKTGSHIAYHFSLTELDLASHSAVKGVATVASEEAIPNQIQQIAAAFCDPIPSILPPDVKIDNHDAEQQPAMLNGSSKLQQEAMNWENNFVVPDLNLSLEDANSEALLGVN
ncbi:hypothetical protein TEA_027520 [Camellia sinensis var. sinensis]|uniref:BZIP domain-containing protein n=1 Tax=Camellia sinensis var. sinensis TaxID=542762 RepID=A0A4V3WQ47_CAMSN|nr:hypothetical protein TEA_027520 [Camellia sinensis var. sinensis]